jgi:hypothetical protein
LVADRGIIPAEGKLVNSGKADFTGFSGILKDFRAFEAWGNGRDVSVRFIGFPAAVTL